MDRLIVIDDEPELGRFVGRVGESAGYEVRVTSRAAEFKQTVAQWNPSVIILDLAMPEVDGLELLRWLAAENCQAHIIIMSGFDPRIVETAKTIGLERGLNVFYNFNKPIRVQDLKEKLEALKKPTAEMITVAELENAFVNHELFLAYQPIVSLKTGALHGVEALVRWNHPSRGVILPEQFLGLTAEPELAQKLTDFVITECITQQKRWMQEKFGVQMSINLCPSDIRSEYLIEQLTILCMNHEVPPDSVTLQVTEEAIMHDSLEIFDILTRLRLKGFQISIDDFGTGYFSLDRLRKLLATELKIDQSFVHAAMTSRDALVIVKTALGVAHSMGLTSVAEGIETIEHYELMGELGCDFGQGFGISKPMSADEMLKWSEWWKTPSRLGGVF